MQNNLEGSKPNLTLKNDKLKYTFILSAAMMLEMSFDLPVESAFISRAVNDAIEYGYVTKDTNPRHFHNTSVVGDKIADFILNEVFENV